MSTEHTPTPWFVIQGSIYATPNSESTRLAKMDRTDPGTCPVERDANAHFIVQAVNSHDELVHAASMALKDQYGESIPDGWDVAEGLRAALAKAEGAA